MTNKLSAYLKTILWIGVAIALATVGGYLQERFLQHAGNKKNRNVIEKKWHKGSYGNDRISFESPVALRQDTLVSETLKSRLSLTSCFYYSSGKDTTGKMLIVFTIMNSHYTKGGNLDSGLDNGIRMLRLKDSIQIIKHDSLTIDSVKGKFAYGNILAQDKRLPLHYYIFAKDTSLFCIIMIFFPSYNYTDSISRKIISSIHINDNPKLDIL